MKKKTKFTVSNYQTIFTNDFDPPIFTKNGLLTRLELEQNKKTLEVRTSFIFKQGSHGFAQIVKN